VRPIRNRAAIRGGLTAHYTQPLQLGETGYDMVCAHCDLTL
jgi:hypothetical protein